MSTSRKDKVSKAAEKRNRPSAASVGKNTEANSFVPTDDNPGPPSMQMDTGKKIENVSAPTGKVTANIDTGKPKTFSDMLAPMRATIIKDKTDALKMQKYYALADVFNALGKMGGAAIGGAIGGNVLDSAPAVGEYKESRGYLNAFEKARQANDRLRALDEKGFTLALSKQQRDEERAYNEKARAEERSYRQQVENTNREWQKMMIDYKNKIDRADADRDFERGKKLKEDLAALEHKHNMELQRLKNQNRASEQAGSRANMQFQYDLYNKPVQIAFDDGTALEVSKNQYEGLFNFLNGKKIGDRVVNKDNIGVVLRENPKIVNDYLNMFGGSTQKDGLSSTATAIDASPEGAQVVANSRPLSTTGYAASADQYNQWRSEQQKNLVEENPEAIGFDIFSYERK